MLQRSVLLLWLYGCSQFFFSDAVRLGGENDGVTALLTMVEPKPDKPVTNPKPAGKKGKGPEDIKAEESACLSTLRDSVPKAFENDTSCQGLKTFLTQEQVEEAYEKSLELVAPDITESNARRGLRESFANYTSLKTNTEKKKEEEPEEDAESLSSLLQATMGDEDEAAMVVEMSFRGIRSEAAVGTEVKPLEMCRSCANYFAKQLEPHPKCTKDNEVMASFKDFLRALRNLCQEGIKRRTHVQMDKTQEFDDADASEKHESKKQKKGDPKHFNGLGDKKK